MEVIKYAEKHTKREAGRKFKVDESMVRRWVQKEELSKACKKSGTSKKKFRGDGGGRRPNLTTIEDSLMEKIAREREQQHHVSCKNFEPKN